MKSSTCKLLTVILVILIFLLLGIRFAPSAANAASGLDVCRGSGVVFDTSALDQVYLHPEEILADPQAFLDADQAHRLFSLHRQRINESFDQKKWEKKVAKLAAMSPERRKNQPAYILYQAFVDEKLTFCTLGISHLKDYLPPGIGLSTIIYPTGVERPAAGYNDGSSIALSFSHPLFLIMSRLSIDAGVSAINNLVLHELYHTGFGQYDDAMPEYTPENEIVLDILNAAQFEGMATYVAYKITPTYPSPFEYAYYFFQRDWIVRLYIWQLNKLLEAGQNPPPLGDQYNDLYRRIGRFGYKINGFYVVGAYMAERIEEEFGREALVQTIVDGSSAFCEAYNAIAEDGMRLYTCKLPGGE